MKTIIWIALPSILWSSPPLTLEDVLAKSKVPIGRLNVDAALAEARVQVKEGSGFLRESPSVALSAGPRSSPSAPITNDQTIEIDVPLMLRREPVRQLASSLKSASPLLYSAAELEHRLAVHSAFLDAWLADRIEAIRVEDNCLVRAWLGIAQLRNESGADPAFQLELVKGELLKSRMDWEDAKRNRLQAWNVLKALSDIPESPQELEYQPGGIDSINVLALEARYQSGAIRRAHVAKQNVEMSQINLHAAQSNSRWSLSSSYAKESDDRIAKFGLAFKFPRPGESSAIRAEQRARLEASKRTAELELAELDLRFANAVQTIESYFSFPEAPDALASLEALTLRLHEGKDQPSDAIPIRRQFLEIRIAEMQRLHSLYIANAELMTLTAGNQP
jgi:outer membrane protein TolC